MTGLVLMEVIRAVTLGIIVVFLLWEHGNQRNEHSVPGWKLVFAGFLLLWLGSLLDITDNFPSLNYLVVIGHTPTEAFLEKIPGYLGGFFLLTLGLFRWMPGLRQLQHEITLRKNAERYAQKQQVFLQSVIDAIPDPLTVIDYDCRVMLQNRASKDCLRGRELPAGPLRCHWLSHNSDTPCNGQDNPCPLREVRECEQVVTLVHRHLDGDGKRRNVEITAAPLFDAESKLVGMIELCHDISGRLELQQHLGDRKRRLQYLTWHDSLTGLHNRNYFRKQLQMALQTAHRLAVLVIDLDDFKRINEGMGRIAGDEILSEMANRLSAELRSNDVLARQDDEFLLMTRDRVTTERTSRLARKILAVIGTRFELPGQIIYPHVSIGIAEFPEDGREVDTLLQNADIAAHRAFEAGGHRLHHFSVQESDQARERLVLEAGLREAIEKEQLVVYYQPQVTLESGEVIGSEALVRWQHPQRGLVPPGKFIPLAETNGQIAAIGEWVLQTACTQAVIWSKAGLLKGRIAVNLSARQFEEKRLVEKIAAVLQRTGCPAAALEVEVTESLMLLDTDQVALDLQQLRELGIRVAMDDFGTGYSSMLQLHRLPIDKIKIDQGFVRTLPADTNAAKITRSIIALARSMDLEVIAEGVETTEQQNFLLAEGCHEGQGFLYSKAIPGEAFTALLERDHQK